MDHSCEELLDDGVDSDSAITVTCERNHTQDEMMKWVEEWEHEEEDSWYIREAREQFEDVGTLEFDDEPVVSKVDGAGAYIQCWVWVGNEEEDDAATEDTPAVAPAGTED